MSVKKWIYDQAERKSALPLLFFPSASLLGVSVNEIITDASLSAKGLVGLAEKFDMPAIMRMTELWPEAEAFGAKVDIKKDTFPKILGPVVSCDEDIEALRIPDVCAGHTGTLVESLRKTVELAPSKPVFVGVSGPFSLSGVLMNLTEMMMNCYSNPELSHILLEKVTQFLTDYCTECKSAGAAGVILADPSTTMLSPEFMDKFSNSYIKRIIDSVKEDDFAVIYHNCGNVTQHLEAISNLGADGYHFGEPVDMAKALQIFPEDTVVMGNIPSAMFDRGSAEKIEKAVASLFEKCGQAPNFIISSGCEIPPVKSLGNIEAFFNAVEKSKCGVL